MVNAKLTYREMDVELSNRSEEELIALLDSTSVKIGDTAASLLSRRDAEDAVYDALCDGRLKTALGRKRALFTLLLAGPGYGKSLDACVHLLRDRSKLVVNEALFGLCHWNDQSTLAALETVTCGAAAEDVELAQRAIKARNLRIFSPYYSIHEKWSEHQSFAG
jgi:hypothetical protein